MSDSRFRAVKSDEPTRPFHVAANRSSRDCDGGSLLFTFASSHLLPPSPSFLTFLSPSLTPPRPTLSLSLTHSCFPPCFIFLPSSPPSSSYPFSFYLSFSLSHFLTLSSPSTANSTSSSNRAAENSLYKPSTQPDPSSLTTKSTEEEPFRLRGITVK